MIDYDNIKTFWESRSRCSTKHPESMVNFEDDTVLLREKIKGETDAIMPLFMFAPHMDVLDMGAGWGQWALRFAPLVSSVTAVDYQQNFLDQGRKAAQESGLNNIEFYCCPVEEYKPSKKFHRIFFSGIFVHLSDEHIKRTLGNVLPFLFPKGLVILREPTSILNENYQLDHIYSEALRCNYSALYRTADELKRLWSQFGFFCCKEGQIFPEGSIQNKFSETRLCYYVFTQKSK